MIVRLCMHVCSFSEGLQSSILDQSKFSIAQSILSHVGNKAI